MHNLVHLISGEDLSKEEHLDNELLWNLKLLSEVSNILTFATHCISLKVDFV